ncbi:MAG: proline--tRNA ligase [Bacillota bacterium]
MQKADNAKEFVKEITPRDKDFSQWYIDVVLRAELADYSPVRGCMVIRPHGYAIWENIQKSLDERFRATGHQNAYFPLFIPESFFQREAEHVEGFTPEVAWVTQGGSEPLTERLAVRPTSETIICTMYSKWIQSWRDLPVLINQWCNVVRWEKATRPFLRTAEFLWQEGHTVHASEEEAEAEALRMLDVYKEFAENVLAIPVIAGKKTEREKFAGALRTYTIEALMSDGKALQAGTSHNLGQHFAKVFDITYLDKDGQLKYGWQTSWGVSTRLIGALIMVHGDDRGLSLPPAVAPIEVAIVPIMPGNQRERVLESASALLQSLTQVARTVLDSREEYTPGWKFNEWEMRGVPVRVELGPRDIANNQVVLVRRDTGEKIQVGRDDVARTVRSLLDTVQRDMLQKAARFRDENTRLVSCMDEFKEILQTKRGFLLAGWCGHDQCETSIKETTGATVRCLPFEEMGKADKCVCCGEPAVATPVFARAY